MKKPSGYVIYEGPSQLTGEPIVAILTIKSRNKKTGDLATVWYLNRDINPVEAQKTGKDESVCGKCPHRKGSCYVQLGKAPLGIFKAYKRGAYPSANASDISHLYSDIRFGGYGDGAAIPARINKSFITTNVRKVLGYTHQWKSKTFDKATLDFCQGSVDTLKDTNLFKRLHPTGKYFRVTKKGEPLLEDEIVCKNEVDSSVKCVDCGICNGKKANVTIVRHGSPAVIKIFDKNFRSRNEQL